jgi:hypothetical protein
MGHYTNAEELIEVLHVDSDSVLSTINYGGGEAAYNAIEQHSWWGAANDTTTTGTEYMRLDNESLSTAVRMQVGDVDATPIGVLDLYGNVGRVHVESIGTNLVQKDFSLTSNHYTVAEENIQIFSFASGASDTFLGIGGGSGSFNHPTRLQFVTAATVSTLTATVQWEIDPSGHLIPNNSGRNIGDSNDGVGDFWQEEQATMPTGAAGFGVTAVEDSTPNVLKFIDDADNEHPLSFMQEIVLTAHNAALDYNTFGLLLTDGETSGVAALLQTDSGSNRTWIFYTNESGGNIRTAWWMAVMPSNYAGGGITAEIRWHVAGTNTGTVDFQAEFERNETGIDMDAANSFSGEQTASPAGPGVAGEQVLTTIDFTDAQIDGIGPGDLFRFALRRGSGDGQTGTVLVSSVRLIETNSLAAAA